MTKKHFIALADTLRSIKPPDPSEDSIGMNTAIHREGRFFQWEDTVKKIADFCQRQNSNFNRERWLAYIAGEVGPNGGKRGGR